LTKTPNEVIDEYLNIGKRGGKFSDDVSSRKKGVIENFLKHATKEGYGLRNLQELISEEVTSTTRAVKQTKLGEEKPYDGKIVHDLEQVRVLPVYPEHFIRRNVPKFVETQKEFKRLDAHLRRSKPFLLIGPKGIGKTLSVDAFAEKNGLALVRYDCSENTKSYDFIGRYLPVGDEVVFQLGILPTAIEVANKSPNKMAVLVLEELSALTGAMQKVLNQLLDYRNSIFVPGINKHYQLAKDARLLICATMNPSDYGGTHELNEDLKSRFPTWKLKYPTERKEARILNTEGIEPDLVKNMILLAKETRGAAKKGEINYALSPRDLDTFFELIRAYEDVGLKSFELAMEEAVFGQYETDQEEAWIKQRVESIFGETKSDDETETASDGSDKVDWKRKDEDKEADE